LHLADFSFARFTRCPPAIFFSTGRTKKMEHHEVIVGDPSFHHFSDQRARELMVRPVARALFQAMFESEPQAHGSRNKMVAHCAAV
jgi:hypothetical protein